MITRIYLTCKNFLAHSTGERFMRIIPRIPFCSKVLLLLMLRPCPPRYPRSLKHGCFLEHDQAFNTTLLSPEGLA